MVLSFNMINLFPELAKQAHINPLPRRQRLAVQFFMNNTDDKKYPCRMRVTLRHLAILAILSSPFQMLTLDELDRMIRPVVPQQSHGTLRDSIRLVVWKCAEFEKIGGKNHGNRFRWHSERQREMLRPNYLGSEMDKILRDTEHAYHIVIENLAIKAVIKTDLV